MSDAAADRRPPRQLGVTRTYQYLVAAVMNTWYTTKTRKVH